MTIKLRREKDFFYAPVTGGLLDKKEQRRADEIYASAKNLLARKIDQKDANINTLMSWFKKGALVNQIIQRFKITEVERNYFWMMLYEVTGMTVPDRIRMNDFRIASILAEYPFKKLQQVGAWSTWREIVGSTKIGNDDRVAHWAVSHIVEQKIKTRKQTRPLLIAIRGRLKGINTAVLSNKELINKLNEIIVKEQSII